MITAKILDEIQRKFLSKVMTIPLRGMNLFLRLYRYFVVVNIIETKDQTFEAIKMLTSPPAYNSCQLETVVVSENLSKTIKLSTVDWSKFSSG